MKSASVEIAHGMMRHASSYSIISFHVSPLVGTQRGLDRSVTDQKSCKLRFLALSVWKLHQAFLRPSGGPEKGWQGFCLAVICHRQTLLKASLNLAKSWAFFTGVTVSLVCQHSLLCLLHFFNKKQQTAKPWQAKLST